MAFSAFWGCQELVALDDIQKEKEILDNYLVYAGGWNVDDWETILSTTVNSFVIYPHNISLV
jgi:hypothetical protein